MSVKCFQRGAECRCYQSAVSLVGSGFYEVICNQVKHGKRGLRDDFAVPV